MGQKVHPHGLRVGVIKGWDAKWYADKRTFADNLIEDNKIREFVKKELFPGVVIGKGGAGIEALKAKVAKLVNGKNILINIVEVKNAEANAQLVAENIAGQLERRIGFRRAMKQAVGRTMRLGAKGIKIMVSGRLGGAEIARSESYREGSIPLHTLRADIDYGTAEAHTTYGCIGIKVWIYKGEVLPEAKQPAKKEEGGK